MNHLPSPPPAYWDSVPWWGYFGFVVVALLVLVVLGPWAIQVARGSPAARLSREQSLQANVDAERARLAADRDQGWDIARGALPVMHDLWHRLANATQERNNLVRMIGRMLDGRLSMEAARDRLAEFGEIAMPDPLPELEHIAPKKPGETKYA